MLSHPTFSENNYYNFIIFDTETTTIGKSAEIIQIAATTDEGVFSEYIQPKTRTTQAASNVHVITSSLINGELMLFKNGQQLSSKTQAECLPNFITFIEKNEEKCKQKTYKPSVVTVLIGHNASTFDTPVLLRSAPSTFSARLKSLGVIFADSLVLIKHLRTCSINTAFLSNLPEQQVRHVVCCSFQTTV